MATNNKRKELSGYQKRKNKRLRELNISIMNHGQTTLSDFFHRNTNESFVRGDFSLLQRTVWRLSVLFLTTTE
jgi:hypothetical protein